ncbi:MAG: hypothetical protein LBT00_11045 [Spirochaetaceae bacterium]|nr:hypothetical protein [Spirochaetaceae bacterium]
MRLDVYFRCHCEQAATGRQIAERSNPVEGLSRLDCFTLRVRNDNTPRHCKSPVIASVAKQSSARGYPVWIASPCVFAMTTPPVIASERQPSGTLPSEAIQTLFR